MPRSTTVKGYPGDNRADERINCRISGRISFNDVFIADCVIKDMSVSGFRAFIAPDIWMPNEFYIDCKHFDAPIKARIRWRTKELLGAAYMF